MIPDRGEAGFAGLNTKIKRIKTILASHNMQIRSEQEHTGTMILAVQPLVINGEEICGDTVLAEFISYETFDQMVRETATVTIKKAAFSAFEPTLTPVPKYCFKDTATLETVLVHPVPRFTLEDVLAVSETRYEKPYTYDRMLFYSDWGRAVVKRVTTGIKPGWWGMVRALPGIPKAIFPEPPRIVQAQRRAFAALILRAVGCHHRGGIFHDCISEKTVFFPSSLRPQILSNYSGMVSPMLADFVPPELLSRDAAEKFGPHCRDVYCCALICYRIMTGKKHDGKSFSLETPRPAGMVVRDIANRAGFRFSGKNVRETWQSVVTGYATIKGVVALVPLLFRSDTFTAWRTINRATGGLWRALPYAGSFADMVFPTRAARTLRHILDKSWFINSAGHTKQRVSGAPFYGPDIKMLLDSLNPRATFRTRRSGRLTRFESALNQVNRDAVMKREAFGSIMRPRFSIQRAYRVVFLDKPLRIITIAVLSAIIIIPALMYNRHRIAAGVETNTRAKTVVSARERSSLELKKSAPSAKSPGKTPVIAPVSNKRDVPERLKTQNVAVPVEKPERTVGKQTAVAPDSAAKRQQQVPPANRDRKPVAITATRLKTAAVSSEKRHLASTNGNRKITPKKQAAPIQKRVPAPATGKPDTQPERTPVVATSPPKPVKKPKGLLYAAKGYKDVFIVKNVDDSCNPGRLFYIRNGREENIMISRLKDAERRLYMTHRTSKGYTPIMTIRLCRSDDCNQTMYYEPVGIEGIGKPVYVKTGDAISASRWNLRMFMSMGKKK